MPLVFLKSTEPVVLGSNIKFCPVFRAMTGTFLFLQIFGIEMINILMTPEALICDAVEAAVRDPLVTACGVLKYTIPMGLHILTKLCAVGALEPAAPDFRGIFWDNDI